MLLVRFCITACFLGFFFLTPPPELLSIWQEHESSVNMLKLIMPFLKSENPSGIYLFKANNWDTGKMCEISSMLIMTPKQHHSIFFVNFEQISHIDIVFPMLTLNNYKPVLNDYPCGITKIHKGFIYSRVYIYTHRYIYIYIYIYIFIAL